jgi:LPS-assembly protein
MRRVGCILSLAAAVVFFAEEGVCAEASRGEPATIDAEQLSFDRPSNTALGEGNVVIKYKGTTLRADRVRFNSTTKEAWADGHVRLDRGNEEWAAPAAYYNFETGEFKADEVRGFLDPLIVSGTSIHQVGSNHYAFATGTLTTCDYDPPHYRLQASHAEVWSGDRVTMYNVTVRFGNVPVFWFPVVVMSLKDDTPPVALSVGQSSRAGFFVLSSTHWQLGEDLKFTLHLDERTRRGVGVGGDLQYRTGTTGEGLLRGYYINDAKPRDDIDIATGKNIPRNRYRAQWQHKQALTEDIDLTANMNKLSDPDVIDDFFNREFQREREPESVIDVTQRGPNHTLSLQARPEFNVFFAEVERLPEAKLSVNRMRVGSTPLFYESETSAGYLHNIQGLTGDSLYTGDTGRADTFHQVTLPATLFGWLSVVPRAGARETYYLRGPAGAPDTNEIHRAIYDLGLETSFKMSRTWDDVQSTRWRIDGLRHIVQPFANYSWVPSPSVKSNEVFQFDTVRSITLSNSTMLSLTRFSPIDFPAFNTIDGIDKENVVRFGLRQKLQTRRDGRPWDLAELTGWTDWRIEQTGDHRDFNDLYGMLRLRPVDWISLDLYGRYDMNNGLLQEFNTSAQVVKTDLWAVGLETRLLRHDSNLVGLSQRYRLSRRWTVQTYHRVELQDGQWEEQEYMLEQETHDWLINYGVRLRNQRTQKDEVAFFVAVTLKAFPGAKLGVNRIDVGSQN